MPKNEARTCESNARCAQRRRPRGRAHALCRARVPRHLDEGHRWLRSSCALPSLYNHVSAKQEILRDVMVDTMNDADEGRALGDGRAPTTPSCSSRRAAEGSRALPRAPPARGPHRKLRDPGARTATSRRRHEAPSRVLTHVRGAHPARASTRASSTRALRCSPPTASFKWGSAYRCGTGPTGRCRRTTSSFNMATWPFGSSA